MDKIQQYTHVSNEQINLVLNNLVAHGFKIDLKTNDAGFPQPSILERRGCKKIYIFDKGVVHEARVVFNCGSYPYYAYFKVRIKTDTSSYFEIRNYLSSIGKILRQNEPGEKNNDDRFSIFLSAIYKEKYSEQSFGRFIEDFSDDYSNILKMLLSK